MRLYRPRRRRAPACQSVSATTPTGYAALDYWPASPLLDHCSACAPTSHTNTTASTARTTTPNQILCIPRPSITTPADSRQHLWQPTTFDATARPGYISTAARTAKSAVRASHITNRHQHRHRPLVGPSFYDTHPHAPDTKSPPPPPISAPADPDTNTPKKASAHWHKLCKNGFGRAMRVRNLGPPAGLVGAVVGGGRGC